MGITEFMQTNPYLSIITISFLVSFFVTIVRFYMTDREKMREIKSRQKELRKKIKEHRNNPEKMMEFNKQMMQDMPEQMKQSFKPMIITMIPVLILFRWLWSVYGDTPLSKVFIFFPAWLWWYIIASIVLSLLLSKLFKLQ
ncbi:MAG: EMC3/TMCO1 family protein [archaeon]